VDGKFFRARSGKFYAKGITYGPFAPNSNGEMFASPEQTARDFKLINELGANVLRVYYAPPIWLLDLAAAHGLRVLVDIPWAKHLCFMDSKPAQVEAKRIVREAVRATRGHPAIFAYSVVNEIAAEIVRWSGVARIEKFIDDLVAEAKSIDPECLCTFTSFPPTEFLRPESVDFICFNVYLHHQNSFEAYLARLQTLADAKPLVLGEFGLDSIRETEAGQSNFLSWQIESAFRGGLAGTVVFSFTDDWFRGGMQIEDWGFGLTTRDRQPKESFRAVQHQYQVAPHFPLPKKCKVSVVVATYNGARTLRNCLESLGRLNYPDCEIIVVDDGSTDQTPEIARQFPSVRYIRQTNQGLSAARNSGIRAATGEIVAFTDDDCRADEDWLYYLVGDLLRSDFAGIGGHNFLPPEDSRVAAAVAASPGGPAHVMLTDREAEHIPGCNMAFYKWALEEIGMFDPIFHKAGDDVDVCWRTQDRGRKIGFSPAGFVWHFRRSTVKAYLKQQAGYGEAEALLIGKHPEHFNSFGGGLWHGRIYASSFSGLFLRRAVIYHGVFGSGLFQRLYTPEPALPLMLCTSLGYHVLINIPLLLLAYQFYFFVPLAFVSMGLPLTVCILAAAQAKLPRQKDSLLIRSLVALLFFLQPVVRGWSRFKWRWNLRSEYKQIRTPVTVEKTEIPELAVYWSNGSVERYTFLGAIETQLEKSGWDFKTDTGWTRFDLEILTDNWSRLKLTTVSEELEQGRKTFRCRVRACWSAPAKIVFGITVAVVWLLIAGFAETIPWLWMSLLLLPVVCWLFDDEQQQYQRALAVLLDDVANAHKLVKLDSVKK
jgi:glycosyltransferase involved in cell wall biosynthesis